MSWFTVEAPANFSGLVTVVKFQESRLPTTSFLVGKLFYIGSCLLVNEIRLLHGIQSPLGDGRVLNLARQGLQIEAVCSNQHGQPCDFPLSLLPGTKCFFHLSIFYCLPKLKSSLLSFKKPCLTTHPLGSLTGSSANLPLAAHCPEALCCVCVSAVSAPRLRVVFGV